MSEAAYARVRDHLASMDGDLDVVTIDPHGAFALAGAPIDAASVDPEVFWISLDLYRSGQLPLVFQIVLGGARGKWAQLFAAGVDNAAFTRIMAKGVRLTKSSAQAPMGCRRASA